MRGRRKKQKKINSHTIFADAREGEGRKKEPTVVSFVRPAEAIAFTVPSSINPNVMICDNDGLVPGSLK